MAPRLLRAERLEPPQTFACEACDPPGRRPRVRRRYRFTLIDAHGREAAYWLPCAAEQLGIPPGALRRIAVEGGT
jgi:hypothetical protein